jgi:RNA polymerase-binding transcription factor DksA
MADFIDDAQVVNELHQELSLREQRAKVMPETHPDFDGAHCIDCEDEVPAARLSWGRIRCVGCQEHKERVERISRIIHPVVEAIGP